jgi:hypothetical protein
MTRRRKIALWVGGLLLAGIAALYFSPPVQFVRGMMEQMKAGRAYLDSLSDNDIQHWVSRADTLLAEQTNVADGIRHIPVPEDLKTLKILAIDVVPPDCVVFKWLGGMDHTGLTVQRSSNGQHTVTARYDDEHVRQLWPK